MPRKSLVTILALAFAFYFSGTAAAYVLLPQPRNIIKEGQAITVDAGKVVVSTAIDSHDKRVLNGLKEIFPGLKVGDAAPSGGVFIHAAETMDAFAKKYCGDMGCENIDPGAFGPQEYFLGIIEDGGIVNILILFKHGYIEKGVGEYYGEYYATRTLKQLFENGTLPEISIHDWPDFEIRGVLEGFYGKPWPDDSRLEMLPWMADYKFNIYLYTPKDDHKLRIGWRSSLSEKELREIKELNDIAYNGYMKYCWSLSPGININFSSEKDMKAAYRKFKSVLEIGVRCFSLAFDDVGPNLSPNDRGKFDTYWEGQVKFSNRVIGKLWEEFPDATFAFVPNDYWGNLAPESESLRYLGENLDRRFTIGWTGNKIIPETVVAEDAVFYEYYIKRKPLLGDNYPVTDNITLAGGRLSMGPLRGRDGRLYRYVSGFVANGSPLPETSKPAFLTIADYTWNSMGYDADESWLKTCKLMFGEDSYEPFMFFSKQSESSFIWKYDAVDLFEKTRAVIRAYQNLPDYNMKDRAPALRELFRRFSNISGELEATRNEVNSKMLDEMPLWITKLEDYGNLGLRVLDMIEERHAGGDVYATDIDILEADWRKAEENKAVMTKMVMHNFLNTSIALLRDEGIPEPEKLKTLMTDE
mgnify:CR=1 FL=1